MDSYADDDAPDAPFSYTPSDQALSAFRQIESGGNPNAQTGSYKGLYQLSDGEFRKYGGQGSIFDPNENHRIAKLKIADEGNQLAQKLGRPVTDAEVYLAHQQGVGGAYAHLSNPDQPAWQSMAGTGEGRQKGSGWARQAIWGNIPDQYKAQFGSVDNVTSGDFAKMWNARFSRAMGQPTQALAFAGNSDSNTSPAAAAINKAVKKPGALSMASNNDDDEEDKPALANANGTGSLFGKQEGPNKLIGLGSMLSNVAASLASITNPAQAKALREQAQGFDQQMAGNYQYMLGPNGQLVRIDKNSGNVTSAAIPGSQKGNFHVVPYKDAAGNPQFKVFDMDTGKPVDNGGGGDAPTGPQIGGDPNLEGEERLNSMSPEDKRMAIAMNEGRQVVTQFSLRNPKFAAQWAGAQAAFPGLDMNTAQGLRTFAQEEAKGGPSAWGGLLRRGNTSLDLLDKTIDNFGQLQNTTSKLGSNVASAENYARHAGSQQSANIIRELEINSGNTASDINSLQNGGRGTGTEREHIKGGLNIPYAPPSEQAAAVRAHVNALESALNELYKQKAQLVGTQRLDADKRYQDYRARLEATKQKLNKLEDSDFSFAPAAKNPNAPAAPQPAANGGGKPPLASFFQ